MSETPFFGCVDHNLSATIGPRVRRGDIREGGYLWYNRAHRYGPSSMHRQQMIAILERHLPASCTVHPKKQLVSYVESEQEDAHSTLPIRLEFADGTTATTDVLIGADGIRSAVRKTMFEAASRDEGNDKMDLKQYVDATFTGMTVYRSLISAEILRKEHPDNISLKGLNAYTGKGRYLVTYPLAQGTLINVFAMVCDPSLTGTDYKGRWVSDATRDELCEKPSKWALHVVKPLPFCIQNRVGLIGDACHAMTPYFSAGAVQAIDVPALSIYEETRFPFACSVASFSLSTGWMHTFLEPGYYDGTRDGPGDDLDDRGIGACEREGMERIKEEIFRLWGVVDDSPSAPQLWHEVESKLQALFD
ncbi:hypothetical protein EV363DRAFT_1339975 [Boletus edulis]|nr:hypothetical protein EV363DRAFT_1339975 [Boletus edulis]